MMLVRRVSMCLALMLTGGLALSKPYSGERELQFNVPSQSLNSALNTFATQSDLNIVFYADSVDGATSPPLSGTFSAKRALNILLGTSSLTYEFVNDRTVAIRSANSASQLLAASDEAARSATDTTTSDSERVANRQSGGIEGQSKGIEQVVITGSRLKRAEGTGAAPVTSFSRKRIEELGVGNVADVLDFLPQQSFAAAEGVNNLGTRVVRLRGLGLGTTLVLIDGRRAVTSALTASTNVFDLNTIPLAAVERIEVLSDSASAIYGADAIGGVVNIVLKKAVERPTFELRYGAADGGADERRASATLGLSSARTRSSIVLDAFDRGFLLGGDRSLFADQDFRRFGSVDRRSPFSDPGNIASLTPANLPGLPSRFAAVPVGSTGIGLSPADFLATSGQRNLISSNRFRSVVPDIKRLSAALSSEIDLTPGAVAFGEFLYTHREGATLFTPAVLVNGTVPAGNPFNPFGVPVSASYLFTGIGPQSAVSKAESVRGVLGLKGALGTSKSWDWELSLLGTHEEGSTWTNNATDPARVSAALGATDPNQALNVFQDGPGGSAALLNSLIAAPRVNDDTSRAVQSSGFLRGSIVDLPAGAIEIVAGVETRKEDIHFESKPALVLSADRRSWATYSELRLPFVSAGMQVPAIQTLAITAAGRYDHYSDFGGTFNPQYGIEWTPTGGILIRASYGTSFRPPSLFELYRPTTVVPAVIPDPRRRNELAPFTSISGGNPNLDPEQAESWTAGIVLNPFGRLRVTASYWSIRQDQRVQAINSVLLLANETQFSDRIVRAAPTPLDTAAGLPGRLVSIDSTSVNFGSVYTKGIDIETSSSFDMSVGTISPTLNATWVGSYQAADLPNTPAVERVNIANTAGTIPRWRVVGGLTWAWHGLAASSAVRYVPPYADVVGANVLNGRTVPSQTLVDLQASADVGRLVGGHAQWLSGVTVRVGASNLFNKQPGFAEVGASFGFDPSQADLRQRFIYGSLSKRF